MITLELLGKIWFLNKKRSLFSDAFDSNMSLCIFRNEELGLDHSALLSNDDQVILRLPMNKCGLVS
jgi:tRNA(Leu) C34 or U34 (ribose-2'-O)-methylase TrmL